MIDDCVVVTPIKYRVETVRGFICCVILITLILCVYIPAGEYGIFSSDRPHDGLRLHGTSAIMSKTGTNA